MKKPRCDRREFLSLAALTAAAGVAPGCLTQSAQKNEQTFTWGTLIHFGMNNWRSKPLATCPYPGGLDAAQREAVRVQYGVADHVRFDEETFHRITEKMAAIGMNMVVIDLGEALAYPSHPELAVKGSWSPDRFRKELGRLRGLGLEPIPKLNFSTSHDTWLKDYHRMVSTPKYYEVCRDLVGDVCEIFDRPRFFHLGYDEESAPNHKNHRYCVVRQGELWWHDLEFFCRTCMDLGMRPWIWGDAWTHKGDEFTKRLSRDVLLSGWYYKLDFENEKNDFWGPLWREFEAFEKAGFDQIPCSSNFYRDGSFEGLVARCDKLIAPERLKGYLMAPWKITLPGEHEKKNFEALDQVAAAMKTHKANVPGKAADRR